MEGLREGGREVGEWLSSFLGAKWKIHLFQRNLATMTRSGE